MKKLIVILLILCASVLAQDKTWGAKMNFGNTFVTTDSLKIFKASITDSVMNDTLFTSAIPITKIVEGIYGVAAYFDEISGTSASIGVDVRFGAVFYDPDNKDTLNVKWDTWNTIWATCKKDTLYRIGIAQTDSSWWNPAADVRQYRLREADADTVSHNVADYIR